MVAHSCIAGADAGTASAATAAEVWNAFTPATARELFVKWCRTMMALCRRCWRSLCRPCSRLVSAMRSSCCLRIGAEGMEVSCLIWIGILPVTICPWRLEPARRGALWTWRCRCVCEEAAFDYLPSEMTVSRLSSRVTLGVCHAFVQGARTARTMR